jgi:hypothetical protein
MVGSVRESRCSGRAVGDSYPAVRDPGADQECPVRKIVWTVKQCKKKSRENDGERLAAPVLRGTGRGRGFSRWRE